VRPSPAPQCTATLWPGLHWASMIQQRERTLNDVVDQAMRRLHVPGVAIGILRSDGVEETTAVGVTSIDNPVPVDADTLFQIGSITKTFTATAVMRLIEAGRLDLEAPVHQYLPELRLADAEVTAKITLRHLLTHTAGFIGDDFMDTGRGDDALARYVARMHELPQVTPPGDLFSYCNAGFALVGRIVEVVTGQTYEQAIHRLVLGPLQMTDSSFEPHEVLLHRFVVGHTSPFDDSGEVQIARPWALARAANAAGGLTSSVRDLLKYARLHLNGPAGVLSEQSRVLMRSPLAAAGNFADSVGVAWMLRTIDGTRIVEHSGGTHGQQTTLKLVPDRNFAVAILTNSSRGSELHGQLANRILSDYLGLAEQPPETIELSAERLAEYVGRYEQALSSIDVSARDGRLILQITPRRGFPLKDSPAGPTPPPVAFAFWSNDRIVGMAPPLQGARAEFLRGLHGRIVWLRSGGRLAARQT